MILQSKHYFGNNYHLPRNFITNLQNHLKSYLSSILRPRTKIQKTIPIEKNKEKNFVRTVRTGAYSEPC